MAENDTRVVRVVPNGLILVPGPGRIELPDDVVVESDRFVRHLRLSPQQELSTVRHQSPSPSAAGSEGSP
jgi:hypothetical protein